MSGKVVEVAVEEIVVALEDAGMYQNAGDMREMLSGTKHLRDSDSTVAYYWGWLECLEAQEVLTAAA